MANPIKRIQYHDFTILVFYNAVPGTHEADIYDAEGQKRGGIVFSESAETAAAAARRSIDKILTAENEAEISVKKEAKQ